MYYFLKKSMCEWTYAVQINVVQGPTVYEMLGNSKCQEGKNAKRSMEGFSVNVTSEQRLECGGEAIHVDIRESILENGGRLSMSPKQECAQSICRGTWRSMWLVRTQ